MYGECRYSGKRFELLLRLSSFHKQILWSLESTRLHETHLFRSLHSVSLAQGSAVCSREADQEGTPRLQPRDYVVSKWHKSSIGFQVANLACDATTPDDELIQLTNANSMFKQQARYLVKRRDLDLWNSVLRPDNMHRRALTDQIVGVAVPESTDQDDVSTTVRALMTNDMPAQLIELLEKVSISFS